MVGAAFVALGIFIIIVGYALSGGGSLYTKCGGCKNPMPDGWESIEGGVRRCRPCTNRLGLKPWYWKEFK